jgi:hypothetical protein
MNIQHHTNKLNVTLSNFNFHIKLVPKLQACYTFNGSKQFFQPDYHFISFFFDLFYLFL